MLFGSIIWLVLYRSRAKADDDPLDCHFARSYSAAELFNSSDLLHEFLLLASRWQGVLGRENVGVVYSITMSDVMLDFDTFQPNGYLGSQRGDEILDSDAQSEAIHLSLLAAALDGDVYASEFLTSSKWPGWSLESYMISVLSNKMELYTEFAKRYPGYGGYLPAFNINEIGHIVPLKQSAIEAESVSHFCWAMIAVAQVLQEKSYYELCLKYSEYVQLLIDNGLKIFFRRPRKDRKRRILTPVLIVDPTANVTEDNYSTTQLCSEAANSCNIALFSAPQPFVVFLYLYANWTEYGGNRAKEDVWSVVRKFLDPFRFEYQNQTIVVERRDYFHADDLIKYLILPYLDIPICEHLFLNAEKFRTYYSNKFNYPGLFGSAASVLTSEQDAPDILNPGVPEMAYFKSSPHDAVMPHAAFPLLLHPTSRSYGVVWYAVMLNSTKSQTTVGAIDTIKMTGDLISHTASWKTGAMTVLAFGGGRFSEITKRNLMAMKKYDDFYQFFQQMYISVFGKITLHDDEPSFTLPNSRLPIVGDYNECKPFIQAIYGSKTFFVGNVLVWIDDIIALTLYVIGLPPVVLVLFIAVVEHRKDNVVHKWFTLHLFAVHLIVIVSKIIIFVVDYGLHFLDSRTTWFTDKTIPTYIDRFYLPHCFTLMMSVTLFSMASASVFPLFFKRWIAVGKNWNIYMFVCHVVAMFATVEGFKEYHSYNDLWAQSGTYVIYISVVFYGILLCTAVMTAATIIRMKMRANDTTNSPIEVKTMLSTLSYSIVPTIWCLGSQSIDFILGTHTFVSAKRIDALQLTQTVFRSSYPLAHAIATLIGLAPYRRSLLKIFRDTKNSRVFRSK